MFDPVHLRTFVTVARTLSFTRAASELGLRQSTVSQHIRKLETTAGRRLFARDTHCVELTTDGEALMGFAHSILDADSRAMAHFAHAHVTGLLRFGLSEALAETDITAVITAFLTQNPAVRFELTVRSGVVLERMLADGALDLVLGECRRDDPEGKLAWRDELVWVGCPHTRVDKGRPLPLVLPSCPSTATARALDALRDRGHRWFTAATSSDLTGLWTAVRAGLGLTVHARGLVPDDLRDLSRVGRLPPAGEIDFALKPAARDEFSLPGAFSEALLRHIRGAPGKPERAAAPHSSSLDGAPVPNPRHRAPLAARLP